MRNMLSAFGTGALPEAMIGRVMSLVTLCFAVAGGLVVVAALAGVVWGVPGQMREA